MLSPRVNYATRLASYTNPMDTMGDRIRQLRGVKGLSQENLAQKLGLTKGAVSAWENNRSANVKLATVLKLCEILGCSLDYLVHGPSRVAPGKPPAGARGAGSGSSQT
jgi:transcriptional regulator with XRE-family HTH domain